ncbi:MAG: Holliday junction resolvase RuvX [Patescibacteria group bacterium]
MRLLGIDYGTKRIGLAVGDTSPFFVAPLKTIESDEDAALRIAAIAAEEGAEKIVVGLPIALEGHETGETAALVREFIDELKRETNVPICTEDERLTTALADKLHREYGASRKQKFDRDAVAAAIMLETHVERLRG